MKLNDLWAKTNPFQSVITHGVICGYVCECLCEHFLCDDVKAQLTGGLGCSLEESISLLGYLASLHDIGKIDYHFQSASPELKSALKAEMQEPAPLKVEQYRHEKTGYFAIARIWREQGLSEDAIDVFSRIIGAHHQKRDSSGNKRKSRLFTAFRQEYEAYMRTEFLSDCQLELPHISDGALEALILGTIILSDWISSGSFFSDAESWISDDYKAIIEKRTMQFLIESRLIQNKIRLGNNFTDIWTNIPKDGMRGLQSEIEKLFETDKKYTLILVESPMGEGKTEAAVYAAIRMAQAQGKDGFYIALPTAATSNQMVDRIRALFALHGVCNDVRLLHAMAWMIDDAALNGDAVCTEDQAEIRKWLAPLRRGLLAQYAVGTIDQVLMSVSVAKYSVLRLLGLSGKVLIVDEIHSYDAFMSGYISILLKWCKALRIPVIMLSATLPPNLKQKLLSPYTAVTLSDAYPLITAFTESGELIERNISKTSHAMSVDVNLLSALHRTKQIASEAVRMVDAGGCICILMNTVHQAQEVYSELKTIYDGDLMLFHAAFLADRRNEIEQECIRKYGKDKAMRPKRSILVATQVVEQSLDVDFDAMITAVAPIDLLMQRAGRVFRHEETQRPECYKKASITVLVPENNNFGADAYVYPEALLRQSINVLRDYKEVHIPGNISRIVAEGYDFSHVPESEADLWAEKILSDELAEGKSQQYTIGPPEKEYYPLCDDFFLDDSEQNTVLSVKTRLGEPTQRIAFLEDELYFALEKTVEIRNGAKYAAVKNLQLAKKIIGSSVSVRKSKFDKIKSHLSYIIGDRMISDLIILHSENGKYEFDGGSISADYELGLIIKEGNA